MRLGGIFAPFILAAGFVLLLGSPLTADEMPGHTGPAIWRMTSGESTVYLFGSMHILPDALSWTTPEIERAMESSDLFVFEVPVGDDTVAQERDFVLHNGVLPRRQSIRGLLTNDEFGLYASVMRRAGLAAGDYERYRPWLAALVLGLAYLHPDNLTELKGADDFIMDFAHAHGRQLTYLETPIQQLQLLTTGTEKAQLAGLKKMIGALPASRNLEQELREAWARGDPDGLNALLDAIFNDRPDARDFLVSRRNRLWLGNINALLNRPGTAMITVGAAHLGGKAGLIALICGEGYRVERVLDGGTPSGACQSPH